MASLAAGADMKTAISSRGKATAMPGRKYIPPTAKFVTTRRVWQWDGIEYKSVEQEGYWYKGEWTLAMNTQMVSWDQDHWMFLLDDADNPQSCTSNGEDTDLTSPTLDTPYHLVIQYTHTHSNATADYGYRVQFRIDTGSWTTITSSTTGVISSESGRAGFQAPGTYNGGTGITTLVGASWDEAVYREDNSGNNIDVGVSASSERTLCIQFVGADLSGGETIEFRLVDALFGDDLPDTVNFGAPTATIASAGGGGLPAGSLALLGAGT